MARTDVGLRAMVSDVRGLDLIPLVVPLPLTALYTPSVSLASRLDAKATPPMQVSRRRHRQWLWQLPAADRRWSARDPDPAGQRLRPAAVLGGQWTSVVLEGDERLTVEVAEREVRRVATVGSSDDEGCRWIESDVLE